MARPREFRDNDVLTRAMLLFWQQGFEATGIKQLETATGLRVSSLYNRFGSKESLYAEVLTHYIERVVQWRIDRYLGDPDPIAGIRAFFQSTWDYIDEQRPGMACLLSNSALELGHRHPPLRELIEDGMNRVEQALLAALIRAVDRGQLPDGTDTVKLARQLAMGLQGLLVSTRVVQDKQIIGQHCEAILAPLATTTAQGEPA